MKNDHIAFISHPQYPHVGPTLPIVSTLVRRGYRVTYATSDRFASRVTELGAEVVPFAIPVYTSKDWEAYKLEDLHSVFAQLATRVLDQITPFYESDRPALILYDRVAIAGRILATKWNVPVIQTSPTIAHDINSHSRQIKNPHFRDLSIQVSKQFDAAYERFGIPNFSWLFHREKLNIHLFPKLLQPCADVLDNSCFFASRCAGEQPYYGSWNPMNSGGRPIILIATSTNYLRGPDYFRSWIKALAGLKWHVILSIGDSGDRTSLQPLPPHFEIIQNTSHVKILPHASMLIFLGGIISSAEALYHGVPMLMTSQGILEQEWEAENLASLNLGAHIFGADMNVEALRTAAMQVSEDRLILNTIKQKQRIVRREAGAEETANRIEEYLESFET